MQNQSQFKLSVDCLFSRGRSPRFPHVLDGGIQRVRFVESHKFNLKFSNPKNAQYILCSFLEKSC